jgi:hypothetical protein
MEDSVTKFRTLLRFCVKHKLKLKRSECVLGAPAVKALGFVLNQQGKWIDPDRVLSLLLWVIQELANVRMHEFHWVNLTLCGSIKIFRLGDTRMYVLYSSTVFVNCSKSE